MRKREMQRVIDTLREDKAQLKRKLFDSVLLGASLAELVEDFSGYDASEIIGVVGRSLTEQELINVNDTGPIATTEDER